MKTVIITGAGFNIDSFAYIDRLQEDVRYPSVHDLAAICFPDKKVDEIASIEHLFQQSIDDNDWNKIKLMTESIMKADYYLLGPDNTTENLKPYYQLLEKFSRSPILTFNYDGMVELLLHKKKKWNPADGFGVKVKYELSERSDTIQTNMKSERKILHLHGSLYVYSLEFQFSLPNNNEMNWMSKKNVPDFYFDPDSVSFNFIPFSRMDAGLQYIRPENRIIAPVPNKASSLKEVFIKIMYQEAEKELYDSDNVIVIGYSFAESDKGSFNTLLKILESNKTPLNIISPDAKKISERIEKEYDIKVIPLAITFKEWADKKFLL